DRVEDVLEGQVVRAQSGRVHRDLVLLDPAAPRDDVGHARDFEELALEDPVLQRLDLHQGQAIGVQRVPVDLTDDARQRNHRRLDVARHLGGDQALLHLLTSPVGIRPVAEQDADVGQPEERLRAQEGEVRNTVELLLEGERDDALDLLGGMPRPQRDHLDLHVADVRVRLDGQAMVGHDAADGQEQRQRQRDEALVEGKGDEPADHFAMRLRRMLPVVTTRSWGPTPSRISTPPSTSFPTLTGRRSYSSLFFCTRTNSWFRSRWMALAGRARTRVAPVAIATFTNISALSRRPRLGTTARTLMVR